jgi:hypothetical protein
VAIIDIIQQVCDEIGLPRLSAVVGSTDDQARQLLAIAKREGRELASFAASAGCWPALRREHTFTTVNGTPDYAFPSDLLFFINTTAWDRSSYWPVQGPMSPMVWQTLKSGIGVSGPRFRFRIMQGRIYIDPTPTSANSIVIEYASENWVTSAAGAEQASLLSDGDEVLLPEDPFTLGIIWRFRKAKSLEYADDHALYIETRDRELARASMAPVLSLNARAPFFRPLLDDAQIPDGNFPAPT